MRAFDGTTSIIQPLIAPLYGGHTRLRGARCVLGTRASRATTWCARSGKQARGETGLRPALGARAARRHRCRTALSPRRSRRRAPTGIRAHAAPTSADGLELVFRPDPYVLDGRFANNGWLQELPRPLTKLTWDNAALVAPATAERLGLVQRRRRGAELPRPHGARTGLDRRPARRPDTVTVALGYGRTRAGRVGERRRLRRRRPPAERRACGSARACSWRRPARRTRSRARRTTTPWTAGRSSAGPRSRNGARSPTSRRHMAHDARRRTMTLYPPTPYDGHAWGMTIDLGACIGCNACVVACQAENNISVVGKEQVLRGREMHWIRIDRYFAGDARRPRDRCTSPCPACTARTRRARWSAR